MITLLVGENSFDIQRALDKLTSDFSGTVEKVEGGNLTVAKLPDIFMGASLFADQRVVIIRGLSENKSVWPVLGDWLDKISDDIHLVLVEPKPDKRTATYKALQKKADVWEFLPWSDRDYGLAEKWVESQAKTLDLALDKKCVQTLVQWVGIDQWQLFHALEKLTCVDKVTEAIIRDIIPPNPVENVFNLFETALRGDTKKLVDIIKTLEQTEDVYRLTALLSSQAFQLAAIISAQKGDNVAKDFGIHPYVVSKLTAIANRLGKSGVSKIVNVFIELDSDMKISKAEPWLLVERALIKISNLGNQH